MKGTAMKKKLLVGTITVVTLLGAGLAYADYAVKRVLSNQVVAMLNSSTTTSEIAKLAQGVQVSAIPSTQTSLSVANATGAPGSSASGVDSPGGSNSTSSLGAMGASTQSTQSPISSESVGFSPAGSASANASSGTVFTSRQQVVNYAMSHFTQGEIVHFLTLYMNRSELTVAQKQEIRRQILSHFTADEIQAMAAAAAKFH